MADVKPLFGFFCRVWQKAGALPLIFRPIEALIPACSGRMTPIDAALIALDGTALLPACSGRMTRCMKGLKLAEVLIIINMEYARRKKQNGGTAWLSNIPEI